MDENSENGFFISLDIETSGPHPGEYSILSMGACTLFEPRDTFYVEMKPINQNFIPEAMSVSRLNIDKLAIDGVEPSQAMKDLNNWLGNIVPDGCRPIFLAFNAPFDWMFVNEYFHSFLGFNPFGHSALDIKAYYMGLSDCSWSETSYRNISLAFQDIPVLSHHALQDAIDQANIFIAMQSKEAT